MDVFNSSTLGDWLTDEAGQTVLQSVDCTFYEARLAAPTVDAMSGILNEATLEAPIFSQHETEAKQIAHPWSRPRRPKAPTLRDGDWEPHKTRIWVLYCQQDLELSVVQKIIWEERKFWAEIRQYKLAIKRWDMRKNVKQNEMMAIVRKLQQRRLIDIDRGELAFKVRNRPIDIDRVHRWMRAHGVSDDDLYHPHSSSPTPSVIDCRTVSERSTPAPTPAYLNFLPSTASQNLSSSPEHASIVDPMDHADMSGGVPCEAAICSAVRRSGASTMPCAVHDDAYIGCATNTMLGVKHALSLIEHQISHYKIKQSNTHHDRPLLDAIHEMIIKNLSQLESLQRSLQEQQQVHWTWNLELLHQSRLIQYRLQGAEITILTAMFSPSTKQQTIRSGCLDCFMTDFWQNRYQPYVWGDSRPFLAELIERVQCTKHQKRSNNLLLDLQ